VARSLVGVPMTLNGRPLQVRKAHPPRERCLHPRRIFVGALKQDSTEDVLVKTFSRFGRIDTTIIIKDPITRVCRGFGFVTFRSIENARSAVMGCTKDPPIVNGRRIVVHWAVQHPHESDERHKKGHGHHSRHGSRHNSRPGSREASRSGMSRENSSSSISRESSRGKGRGRERERDGGKGRGRNRGDRERGRERERGAGRSRADREREREHSACLADLSRAGIEAGMARLREKERIRERERERIMRSAYAQSQRHSLPFPLSTHQLQASAVMHGIHNARHAQIGQSPHASPRSSQSGRNHSPRTPMAAPPGVWPTQYQCQYSPMHQSPRGIMPPRQTMVMQAAPNTVQAHRKNSVVPTRTPLPLPIPPRRHSLPVKGVIPGSGHMGVYPGETAPRGFRMPMDVPPAANPSSGHVPLLPSQCMVGYEYYKV
ncbi:hypothetical protein KIPB_008490, partial [Kipferlia bialata]